MENTEAKAPVMLTIPEVSKRTGLSYQVIRRMCLRGEVVTVKCGRRTYVNFDSLIRYFNGERKKTE